MQEQTSNSRRPDDAPTPPAFAGQWDDRGAALRTDPAILARPDALVLPMWRGRPLVTGQAGADGADGLAAGWVAPDSAVLAHGGAGLLFLGLHEGRPRLAADISSWEPDAPARSAAAASFVDAQEYRHPALSADHRFVDLRGVMTGLAPDDAAMAATARALFNWHRTHGFCAACGNESAMAQAGWERHCPACGARHYPRTDPVVIMLVVRGEQVLLGRSPGWPAGMFSALAGFVEPGESAEHAVRREVQEETGVRVGAVRFIASQPWPCPNSLMLGFLAEAAPAGEGGEDAIDDDDAIILDQELEDARWFTRAEMAAVIAGEHPTLRQPRAGAIAQYMLSEWLAGRLAG